MRSLAVACIVVALPLTLLALVPSLHLKHVVLGVSSMLISLTAIIWPVAVIAGVIAWARTRRRLDALIALVAAAGLVVTAVSFWPFVPNSTSSPDAAVTMVVARPRDAADVVRIDNLAAARAAQVIVYTGLTDPLFQALAGSSLINTHSQWLSDGSVAVRSNLPLVRLSADDALLTVSVEVAGQQWALVPADVPTPLDDYAGWISGGNRLIETVVPRRSSPLVVTGSFGNNRHTSPAARFKILGLVDASSQTRTPFAPSWPVGSFVRPVLDFDQTWLGGGVHAVGHDRIAQSGDDYLGFVITLNRPAQRP